MTTAFVCHNSDIDETQVVDESQVNALMTAPLEMSVRDVVMSIWDQVKGAQALTLQFSRFSKNGGCRSLQDLRALLMYSVEVTSRKKRMPVNVKEMVERWVPIIRGLSISHDKAPIDQCEFEMEQHLAPLLTAPVKQIREFYEQLVIALKNDPTIPFFVWAWFESWGEVMLKKAPDGEIKQLKTTLAEQIAILVEEDVKPDLKTAIAGALQWRSSESLEKIKTAVEKGGKARMVGKESCLFLEVETSEGLARVML